MYFDRLLMRKDYAQPRQEPARSPRLRARFVLKDSDTSLGGAA